MQFSTDIPPGTSTGNGHQPLARIAGIAYALQAASFFIAPALFAAAILDYLKRSNARGTWLESHFRWQIRTFWLTLLGFTAGILTLQAGIGYPVLLVTALWLVYRIVRGWLLLAEKKTTPD
jgi:uncharacterized membrane protein